MKKVALMLMLICVLAIIAEDARDFVPAELGYVWVYRDSTVEGISNSTETVIDVYTDLGMETVDIQEVSEESTDTTTFQYGPDGVYYRRALLADMGMDAEIPMRVLPDPFTVGQTWVVFEIDTNVEIMGFPVDAYVITHGEVIGYENVVSPAGTYECIKTEMMTHYEVSSTMFNDSSTYVSFRHWMAEDIGIVKEFSFDIDFITGGGDENISYLVSFSEDGFKEEIQLTPSCLNVSAFPNPFNGAVSFDVKEDADISIYNTKGQLIESLGKDRIWNPDMDITGGIYIVKAQLGNDIDFERISYIK